MAERITDKAWRQIVAVSGAKGTRGKVFRMSTRTAYLIREERKAVQICLTLYGVPVLLDETIPVTEIRLEQR